MAALLAADGSPLLIKMPDGRIVPASGGALVDTGAPTVAAARADNSGAMTGKQIQAAGDEAAAQIAAAQALPDVLTAKRGGGAGRAPNVAANRAPAPGLALPQQPAVMTAPEGSGSDLGALSGLLKALGKNAGSGDSIGPVEVTPKQTGSEPGLLEKFKSFLGIGDKVPDSKTATSAPIDPTMQTAPGPGPVETAALAPIDNGAGALASVPAAPDPVITRRDGTQMSIKDPGAAGLNAAAGDAALPAPANGNDKPGFFERNFGGIIDHGDPLTNGANADTIAARYGEDYKPQDWLDRLKANGARMALLTGGLATMANASRPGATPLGAVGEGALAGLNTAYATRAAQKAEDLAALEGQSKAKLRDAQGSLYDQRGEAALTNAGASQTRAQAAINAAAARQTAADAARIKADAYAKSPFATGSRVTDYDKKKAGWLEVHPGDKEGALAYANGEKQMSNGEIMKSAYGLAGKELAGMIDQPADPEAWVNKRAQEISDNIMLLNKTRAAAPAPSNGALPASRNPGGALPTAPKPAAKGPSKAQLKAQAAAAIQRGAPADAVNKRLNAMLATAPE